MNPRQTPGRNLARAVAAAALVLALSGCRPSPVVTVTSFGTVESLATVEVGEAVGVAVEVHNPGNLPLTFEWPATAGEVSSPSEDSPVGVFTAPDFPSEVIVTVRVLSEGKLMATEAVQIQVTAGCQLDSLRIPIVGPKVNDLTAEIEKPTHCSTQLPWGESLKVGGSYTGNLEGRELWVIVFAPDSRYYPQTLGACDQLPARAGDGRWYTPMSLGGQGQFDIIVAVARTDADASHEFKGWLRHGCETGKYPGFLGLPDGLTELDAVTVRTTE